MKKTYELNKEAIANGMDIVKKAVNIPKWDMISFGKAVKRVTDEEAENVFNFIAYTVAYNRGKDYEEAREKAFKSYDNWYTKARKTREAIEYAEKREGEAPTFTLKKITVSAETYLQYCEEKASEAYARYDRLYNSNLADASTLSKIVWEDDEETASMLTFIDLVSAVAFGYDRAFKKANIITVNRAIEKAGDFAIANAISAGEKTEATTKTFNDMRTAFVDMFTTLCGTGIKFNAKECLYLSTIFSALNFSVGEVDDKTDVYIAGRTERENARQVWRLALYKLEGKKVGEEFK